MALIDGGDAEAKGRLCYTPKPAGSHRHGTFVSTLSTVRSITWHAGWIKWKLPHFLSARSESCCPVCCMDRDSYDPPVSAMIVRPATNSKCFLLFVTRGTLW